MSTLIIGALLLVGLAAIIALALILLGDRSRAASAKTTRPPASERKPEQQAPAAPVPATQTIATVPPAAATATQILPTAPSATSSEPLSTKATETAKATKAPSLSTTSSVPVVPEVSAPPVQPPAHVPETVRIPEPQPPTLRVLPQREDPNPPASTLDARSMDYADSRPPEPPVTQEIQPVYLNGQFHELMSELRSLHEQSGDMERRLSMLNEIVQHIEEQAVQRNTPNLPRTIPLRQPE